MLYLYLKIRFNIMALPLIIPIAGMAMQGLGALASYQRQKEAESKAAQLAGQPLPEYTPTEQTNEQYRMATAGVATPQGYSGAETSKFQNRLAQILATQQANAQNMGGGGVARAIGAIGNANAINSNADFAASDANLSRGQRNIAQSRLSNIVNQIQSMKNQNTSYAMNRRAQTEQALGNAIRSNRDQYQGSLMNMGGDLLGAGLTSRIGMGGATTATPTESASLGGSLGKTYLSTGTRMNLPNRFRNATYAAPAPSFEGVDNTNKQYNFRTGNYE
jgi:hypothetical protein